MALPALLGADCGPSNPLQALSKQYERDRSLQQDSFGPPRAGPSREVFRTQSIPTPGLYKEAAQFFSGQSSSSSLFMPQPTPDAFDLSALRGSLPQQEKMPFQSSSSPAWAGDFLNHLSLQNINPKSHSMTDKAHFDLSDNNYIEAQSSVHMPPGSSSYISGMTLPPMQHIPMFRELHHPGLVHHLQHTEAAAAAINAHFPPEEVAQQQLQPAPDIVDADELARAAGLLIETVKDETNPKFQKSAFLGLMRQLRDKEMVVEGSDMIKASEAEKLILAGPDARTGAALNDGLLSMTQSYSGRPMDPSESYVAPEHRKIQQGFHEWLSQGSEVNLEHAQGSVLHMTPRKSVHFDRPEVPERGMGNDQTIERSGELADMEDQGRTLDDVQDPDAAFWRQENAEYKAYWRGMQDDRKENLYTAMPEWDRLQEDWDRFEATATGVKPVSIYHFQPNNPYLQGESSTRNHEIHMQRLGSNEVRVVAYLPRPSDFAMVSRLRQSILQKEAMLQNDPRNAAAWFELGVKQQENEREPKAIQALQRAVELDPSYLAAWLALAISYTNENDKDSAYDAIEQWVRHNERYDGVQLIGQLEKRAGERQSELIQCLIGLARTAPEGKVDADVQTALGVLLNTSEDYEKAQDCFQTALAVRPDDWLLYNRVGATLANSGRSNDALGYYYHALHLNPSYIRARFNLGISCINMKKYEEAAEHVLDALALQEKDAFEDTDTRGVTSSALWDCLKTTCVHLQRMELMELCDVRDLEGFRKAFLRA